MNKNKNRNYEYKKAIEDDKKFSNELHSTIKIILSLKKYASFIHDVIGYCKNNMITLIIFFLTHLTYTNH